ncbi:MAG: WD40 repeat domain-containing protein [Vicinamibacterales bacterium]
MQQPADVSRSLVVASPTQAGAVDLWSVDGERAAPSLPHGGQAIVRFEPTGRFLVTAADDGLARIWDLAPAMSAAPRIVQDDLDFHSHVVASPDGRSVAVSSGGSPDRGTVRVFDVRTGAPITPAMRFWATDMPVAFSPDGRRLLTASDVGDLRLWDTRTGEPLTPVLREQIPLHFAAFSPDGESFVVAGGMNLGTSGARGARVRRASDGAARTDLLPHNAPEPVHNAWFSRDGRRLLTAATGAGENIKVWDSATGHLVWAARHDIGVAAALWSADGSTVFTGGFDQWIRAWNGSSGASEPPAIKMVGGISSVGVTGDGARLLSGTAAGDVRLVDLAHGGQVISAMGHTGFVYQSRFSPDGSLALTNAWDRTVRLWDGRTGEPLSPSLPAEPTSRSATFLAGGSALAWGGRGVFVDELTIEDGSIEQLRILAESAAGRAISSSGTEVALATEEVETRFMAANRSSRAAAASAVVDYQRARARLAWRRGAFGEVVGTIAPLGAQGALNWPDFMRLVGAYAATSRWQDALGELRKHHARWQAAPELLYMEAVALARLGDEAGAAQHCRAALESTRNARHPERAYWAARACLVPATVVSNAIAEIQNRILLAYPRMSGNLGPAELRGAMLLRDGRSQEAFDLLKSAVPPHATVRAAVLLVASAAARAGLRAEALNWLKRADAIPKPAVYRHMRPWLDAEADALQEEVLSTLNRSSKIRTQSKRRS